MIPKIIYTIWLNSDPVLPAEIERCVATHNIPGYEHRLITLDSIGPKKTAYVIECLAQNNVRGWVRASDYVRLEYLSKTGGIYLDADLEVTGNFDDLLGAKMFVYREPANGYLANSVIGSEVGHPWVKYVLNTMKNCFRTDGELFDAGMQFFTDAYYIADRQTLDMRILEPDGRFIHHSLKSWKVEK